MLRRSEWPTKACMERMSKTCGTSASGDLRDTVVMPRTPG